jgi:hypothetical protein
MAATLTLSENNQRLIYTGIPGSPMAGYTLTIQKNTTMLDVHQVQPLALAQGQTWQTMKAELASRLV